MHTKLHTRRLRSLTTALRNLKITLSAAVAALRPLNVAVHNYQFNLIYTTALLHCATPDPLPVQTRRQLIARFVRSDDPPSAEQMEACMDDARPKKKVRVE